jgi:hypothetical protein
MRTPFILALVASVALPAVPAMAQSTHGTLRVDVQTSMQDGRGDRHDGMRAQNRENLQMRYNQDVAQANREYRRDLRQARNGRDRRDVRSRYDNAMAEARRDYDRGLQEASYDRDGRGGRDGQMARDWRQYRNYDYDRPEPGQADYYADQYYREDASYQERNLSRDERVYRGRDGRYYCRRSDGTTGLIVGAAAGGLFGNAISNGRSSTLGTLLGAAVGATVGASIDRNNVRCR